MQQLVIKLGKAKVLNDGLRCAQPIEEQSSRICNKLLVKKNSAGQIAGLFKCDRCHSIIEVETIVVI